jgi:uncharacterized membrane protein
MTHNTLAFDLILVGAGGLIVAAYMLFGYTQGQKKPEEKRGIDRGFALPMILIGLLGFIGTYQLFFTEWAAFDVGHYSELFGTTLAIFAGTMVIGGLALYTNSTLRPVSYLAALGGVVMFQSVRAVLAFDLTRHPQVTAALYAFAGLAAMGFVPATHIPDKTRVFTVARIVGACLVIAVSLLAFYQGVEAMYSHIASAVAV